MSCGLWEQSIGSAVQWEHLFSLTRPTVDLHICGFALLLQSWCFKIQLPPNVLTVKNSKGLSHEHREKAKGSFSTSFQYHSSYPQFEILQSLALNGDCQLLEYSCEELSRLLQRQPSPIEEYIIETQNGGINRKLLPVWHKTVCKLKINGSLIYLCSVITNANTYLEYQ